MRYRRIRIEGETYFFTLVTEGRRKILTNTSSVALLDEAIEKIRSRHPFELIAQVVLPDHLHAMWSLPEGDANFSMRWRLIKETFTRNYVKRHGAPEVSAERRARGEHAIWQHRFWEHVIRDDRDFYTHLDYIHLNPVHHGLVAAAADWPHSTFRDWVAREVYEPAWGSDQAPELPAWAKRHE